MELKFGKPNFREGKGIEELNMISLNNDVAYQRACEAFDQARQAEEERERQAQVGSPYILPSSPDSLVFTV